jgi:hypothetical protein
MRSWAGQDEKRGGTTNRYGRHTRETGTQLRPVFFLSFFLARALARVLVLSAPPFFPLSRVHT